MSTHDKIIGPQTFNAPVLEGMDSNEVQSPVPHILQVANQILKPFSGEGLLDALTNLGSTVTWISKRVSPTYKTSGMQSYLKEFEDLVQKCKDEIQSTPKKISSFEMLMKEVEMNQNSLSGLAEELKSMIDMESISKSFSQLEIISNSIKEKIQKTKKKSEGLALKSGIDVQNLPISLEVEKNVLHNLRRFAPPAQIQEAIKIDMQKRKKHSEGFDLLQQKWNALLLSFFATQNLAQRALTQQQIAALMKSFTEAHAAFAGALEAHIKNVKEKLGGCADQAELPEQLDAIEQKLKTKLNYRTLAEKVKEAHELAVEAQKSILAMKEVLSKEQKPIFDEELGGSGLSAQFATSSRELQEQLQKENEQFNHELLTQIDLANIAFSQSQEEFEIYSAIQETKSLLEYCYLSLVPIKDQQPDVRKNRANRKDHEELAGIAKKQLQRLYGLATQKDSGGGQPLKELYLKLKAYLEGKIKAYSTSELDFEVFDANAIKSDEKKRTALKILCEDLLGQVKKQWEMVDAHYKQVLKEFLRAEEALKFSEEQFPDFRKAYKSETTHQISQTVSHYVGTVTGSAALEPFKASPFTP